MMFGMALTKSAGSPRVHMSWYVAMITYSADEGHMSRIVASASDPHRQYGLKERNFGLATSWARSSSTPSSIKGMLPKLRSGTVLD